MDTAKGLVRKGSGFFKRDKTGHHTVDDGDDATQATLPSTAMTATTISSTAPQRPSHLRKDSTSSVKAAMQYAAHFDPQPSSSSTLTASPTIVTSPSLASVGLRRRSDSFAPSPLAMSTKGLPVTYPASPYHVDCAEISAYTPATSMTPEESLKAYELFETLRNYDPGHSSSDQAGLLKLVDDAPLSSSGLPTPLHTAVRCAKLGTIDIVLRHKPDDLNARDADGATPLHLAASLGRTEIVKLLLAQGGIDDSIADKSGRTAVQSANGPEVAQIMQVARAQYQETFLSMLAAYVNSPQPGMTVIQTSGSRQSLGVTTGPSTGTAALNDTAGVLSADSALGEPVDPKEALLRYITKDRSKGLDFSALTPGSRGTTAIHEAVRRKDVDILKICAARGASMVIRDRKGKMPTEFAKDDTTRGLLRQGANSEGRALRTSVSGLPALSTSISPATSLGTGAPSSPVMKGYLSKWTNMARGYKTRWFVLHHGHLSYYRDQEEEGQASRGVISMAIATVEVSSDKTTFIVGTTLGKTPRWFLKGAHPVEVMQWQSALKSSIEIVKLAEDGGSLTVPPSPAMHNSPSLPSGFQGGSAFGAVRSSSANTSRSSLVPGTLESGGKPIFKRSITAGTIGSVGTDTEDGPAMGGRVSPSATEGSVYGEDDVHASKTRPPHEDTFAMTGNSIKTQIDLTLSLVASLITAGPGSDDSAKRREVAAAAQRSLKMLGALFDTYTDQESEREKWFGRRWEREMEAKKMWEENMRSVVSSQAELEQQLVDTSRQNERRKRVLKDLKASMLTDLATAENSLDAAAAAVVAEQVPITPLSRVATIQSVPGKAAPIGSPGRIRSPTGVSSTVMQEIEDLADDSGDDQDDFYDAVESGTLPVQVEPALASGGVKEWPEEFEAEEKQDEVASFEGYRNLRTKLPITADERPPVSLWAILKGSIGKDLTKISFPVYFNEPTSMLQRMAEDMEYSECLDAAAAERDSLKRIAYVTGFAMSNYASTIGRIAKPFNPMLSETFEMCQPDKKYRYVSEQVSHHPPMSACIAESLSWSYYGEVDAKSKFLGKSFEIRPTGIAHAELFLPQEWVSGKDYPKIRSTTRVGDSRVREHYSWKKVTTSVSNFIMGSPQIDHYGDMEITNHRTGEKCVLTFKPRGWRGKDACEVKGTVYDERGTARWELAGRWNGQLVARKAGAGGGQLMPDDAVPTVPNGAASPTIAPEYLLIWKINIQPPNMPFNLTKYALTLNDAKPEIKKYLPPTDCRLRPDQHAFEDGRFEEANNLKGALETFQRATRAKRETGELPPHKPRWFTQKKDPDTQASYWEPSRDEDQALEYWKIRLENYRKIQKGDETSWPGVEQIFGTTI